MRDSFITYHPWANLIFFVSALIITVTVNDPLITAVSLLWGTAYAVLIKGRRGFSVFFKGVLPAVLFMMVLNPLFNHGGVTVLFYLPGGNGFTAEALLYGVYAGAALAATVCWFYCFGVIFTAEKALFVFGRVSPYLALTLSLIMTLIPAFKERYAEIKASQSQFYLKKEGVFNQIILNGRCISALIGRVIEDAADIGRGMKMRGFGLSGRTCYSDFIIEKKDIRFMISSAVLLVVTIIFWLRGAFKFFYYPSVGSFSMGLRLTGAVIFAVLLSLPLAATAKDILSYGKGGETGLEDNRV